MNSKDKRRTKYDPYEGVSTEELVRQSRVYDEVVDTYEYVCPYCDRIYATDDDLRAHLDGGEE